MVLTDKESYVVRTCEHLYEMLPGVWGVNLHMSEDEWVQT